MSENGRKEREAEQYKNVDGLRGMTFCVELRVLIIYSVLYMRYNK